jgi:cytochrome c-type biogenesis protein CcmH/NrfF
VQNPLGSEDAAFRLLLWVIAVMAVLIGIVLLVRALS